ncbi:hypothetical protein ScPMuIL_005695 [Solemya velum]
MNLFDHIKQLYDAELYQDVRCLACITLTICDNSTDVEVLSLPQKFQCMVYYGDSLYHLAEVMKAECIYGKALLLRKEFQRPKGKTGLQVGFELTSDVEVKYRMYQCLLKQKHVREAMTVLEGISSKQRTPKINLALAKLYLKAGFDRIAITCYKEVLRECPLALDAIYGLLSLGVNGADVAAIVMNGLPHGTSYDWLTTLIKGQSYFCSQEYTNAVTTFKMMDAKPTLKNNIYIISSIGETRFYEGSYDLALLAFQRAHTLDPFHLKNMDLFAYLLAKEKKTKELEKLAHTLMGMTEQSPEPWIAIGYYSLVTRKATRAVYFAQKATSIDTTNVEGFLLKGAALLDLKKTDEAWQHFQAALTLARHRYEAYHGVVECALASHNTSQALGWAARARTAIGSTARTLTLYASVMAKEPTLISKAKTNLEKAMKLDSSYLEPVYIMAELLAEEHQYEKGIELLRRQLKNHSTCRLHQLLGDFLHQTSEIQEALDQYSIALSLDPSFAKAKEGIERVEKQNDLGLEGGYDVEVEEVEGSDTNDGDFDASDVESTWSDTDFS